MAETYFWYFYNFPHLKKIQNFLLAFSNSAHFFYIKHSKKVLFIYKMCPFHSTETTFLTKTLNILYVYIQIIIPNYFSLEAELFFSLVTFWIHHLNIKTLIHVKHSIIAGPKQYLAVTYGFLLEWITVSGTDKQMSVLFLHYDSNLNNLLKLSFINWWNKVRIYI